MGQRQALELIAASAEGAPPHGTPPASQGPEVWFFGVVVLFFLGFWVVFSVWGF